MVVHILKMDCINPGTLRYSFSPGWQGLLVMRRLAKLHCLRLKITALRTSRPLLCYLIHTRALCVCADQFKNRSGLANNFCFSVRLFIGVVACDTSYILGKSKKDPCTGLLPLGPKACFAEGCTKTGCFSALLQMWGKRDIFDPVSTEGWPFGKWVSYPMAEGPGFLNYIFVWDVTGSEPPLHIVCAIC